MHAIPLTQIGDSQVLKMVDMPTPAPAEGTALIRVKACSVNRIDIWQRSGKYPTKLPHIMGSDCAGIIVEANTNLPEGIQIGSEIIVNPAISCEPSKGCSSVKIFGFNTEGAYAEYAIVPLPQIYPKPQSLTWEQAGAFPLTFLTAWHMLVSRANLKLQEKVLIFGASGGLGSSAIQIAKMLGAEVFAVTRSHDKKQALLQIGADYVLTPDEIPSQTFDVVFDSVGTQTFNLGIKSLKPHGRLVLAGTTSGKEATLDLADLYGRELTILGARMGTKEDFEAMYEHVKNGQLKPVIGATFPLKDASIAHKLMEDGKTLGKIVLTV
ncbi:MAG: zinc-binding dehydrogenase [Candidatus Gracilibacteria bacterium]